MSTVITREGAMRYGTAGRLAQGLVLLVAAGTLTGCGLSGGNTGQVCADTKKAFQQYVSQVRTVPANDPAQWKQATDRFAGRVDGLARQAEDEKLKNALRTEATRLRGAAAGVGTGDAAQLNAVMTDAPNRIGAACD
ncbi:hypothetical protein ABZ801_27675 [Actinomadura sp. NPDC047616]|uniref:hypothetical protein n=1 Tax=Actinomadura sp. NPDC047616 TaxID=3155914 RepID=UPI0033CBB90F